MFISVILSEDSALSASEIK